jgi:hypothetical protein
MALTIEEKIEKLQDKGYENVDHVWTSGSDHHVFTATKYGDEGFEMVAVGARGGIYGMLSLSQEWQVRSVYDAMGSALARMRAART